MESSPAPNTGQPHPHDTDEARLQALEETLSTIEARKAERKRAEEQPPSRHSMAEVVRVISELFAGVLVGSIIGYFLDQWLGTTPWLFIPCFFLGCASSALTIYRMSAIDRPHQADQTPEVEDVQAKPINHDNA